ncbi:YceI family protein [Microbulbifer guangxiensis]|uniref:YceI family protein n=1 Tax=Microbulbifer guangxiensis TaxID=2904249 RepID=UPI001F32B13A|nr:YceI family protein [Microbulbifer guangxiensis]
MLFSCATPASARGKRSGRLRQLLALITAPTLALFAGLALAQQTLPLSASSDIHWRVYRSGPMAHLGHSHVIRAAAIRGTVTLRESPQHSQFLLEIPVHRLEVDPPALRRRYGVEFSSKLSQADIAGTRANMLGQSLLQADRFPVIRMTGEAPLKDTPEPQQMLIAAELQLRGRTIALRLPATVTLTATGVRASGNFTLSHRQLGLKPFSAALGTLKVAERIDFTFDIQTK